MSRLLKQSRLRRIITSRKNFMRRHYIVLHPFQCVEESSLNLDKDFIILGDVKYQLKNPLFFLVVINQLQSCIISSLIFICFPSLWFVAAVQLKLVNYALIFFHFRSEIIQQVDSLLVEPIKYFLIGKCFSDRICADQKSTVWLVIRVQLFVKSVLRLLLPGLIQSHPSSLDWQLFLSE